MARLIVSRSFIRDLEDCLFSYFIGAGRVFVLFSLATLTRAFIDCPYSNPLLKSVSVWDVKTKKDYDLVAQNYVVGNFCMYL